MRHIIICVLSILTYSSLACGEVLDSGFNLNLAQGEDTDFGIEAVLETSSFEFGFSPLSDNKTESWSVTFFDDNERTVVALIQSKLALSSLPPVFDMSREVTVKVLQDGVAVYSAKNRYNVDSAKSPVFVKLEFTGSEIIVESGAKILKQIGSIPSDFVAQRATLTGDQPSSLYRYEIAGQLTPLDALPRFGDEEDLFAALEDSNDPNEGLWQFIDESIDLEYSRRGGNYRLACIKNNINEGYQLWYVNGAKINTANWMTGLLKASLIPSPLQGNFDVEWFDAFMKPVNESVNAYFDEGILTITFPYEKATLRFAKIDPQNNY